MHPGRFTGAMPSHRGSRMALPIFPLNTVLFPGATLPLRIFERRYLRMLSEQAAAEPAFGIALIETGRETADEPTFHDVGTTARLVSIKAQSSRWVDVVVRGDRRIRVSSRNWQRGYAVADTEDMADRPFDQDQAVELFTNLQRHYAMYWRGISRLAGLHVNRQEFDQPAGAITFTIASRLPLPIREQQAILEDIDPISRARTLQAVLARELALLYRGGVAGVPLPTPGDRFTLN